MIIMVNIKEKKNKLKKPTQKKHDRRRNQSYNSKNKTKEKKIYRNR